MRSPTSLTVPLTALVALLAGCAHGGNVERLQAGMTREQVQRIMGPAEGETHSPGRECAYYTVLKDFWSRTPWSLANRYYVCYADGRVEAFGRVDDTTSAQMTGR